MGFLAYCPAFPLVETQGWCPAFPLSQLSEGAPPPPRADEEISLGSGGKGAWWRQAAQGKAAPKNRGKGEEAQPTSTQQRVFDGEAMNHMYEAPRQLATEGQAFIEAMESLQR